MGGKHLLHGWKFKFIYLFFLLKLIFLLWIMARQISLAVRSNNIYSWVAELSAFLLFHRKASGTLERLTGWKRIFEFPLNYFAKKHLFKRILGEIHPLWCDDASHQSIWERVCRKHLKRGGAFKRKLEADWTNPPSITFRADKSDFSLPVKPFGNTMRIPVGVRANQNLINTKL